VSSRKIHTRVKTKGGGEKKKKKDKGKEGKQGQNDGKRETYRKVDT
jgi:hypothetical protein